jgi:hypothetical protein
VVCPNAGVCFGGIGFQQQLEPVFDSGEALIEIEPSHVRLCMSSARAWMKHLEKTGLEDVGCGGHVRGVG